MGQGLLPLARWLFPVSSPKGGLCGFHNLSRVPCTSRNPKAHANLQFQGAVQATAGVLTSASTGALHMARAERLGMWPESHKVDETPAFLGTEAWSLTSAVRELAMCCLFVSSRRIPVD